MDKNRVNILRKLNTMRVMLLSIAFILILLPTKNVFSQENSNPLKVKLIENITQNYLGLIEGDLNYQNGEEEIFEKLDQYSGFVNTIETGLSHRDFKEGYGIKIRKRITPFVEYYVDGILCEETLTYNNVQKGDVILSVNKISTSKLSLQEIYKLLRDTNKESIKVELKRKERVFTTTLHKVYFEQPGNGLNQIGLFSESDLYIDINHFDQGIVSQIKSALFSLNTEGMRLIIDVRDNKGGLLTEVVELCQWLIPEGDIVTIVDNKGEETFSSKAINTPFKKIYIITNQNSMSASEILASAIQESQIGKVVGTKSFGKNSVQTLYKYNDSRFYKLTTAFYLTRNRNYIGEKGVEPDILISDIDECNIKDILSIISEQETVYKEENNK